jgi:hypothetical protein
MVDYASLPLVRVDCVIQEFAHSRYIRTGALILAPISPVCEAPTLLSWKSFSTQEPSKNMGRNRLSKTFSKNF